MLKFLCDYTEETNSFRLSCSDDQTGRRVFYWVDSYDDIVEIVKTKELRELHSRKIAQVLNVDPPLVEKAILQSGIGIPLFLA